MLIGDTVTYDGRTHVVIGFTPTSVKPAQVELSDPKTGNTFWIDLEQDAELGAPQRAALRLVSTDRRSTSR
jgi:hypothetical protein